MNQMVTIPRDEYDRLLAAAEDLADLQAYDRAMADLASGKEELIPAEYVNRILGGESPVRAFRDLRGMTQAALAEASGVNRVYIAEIEGGKKAGSAATLKKLAEALHVDLDDLV
ncbi:helix-turn-helix domain-containing protein [Paracoccus kondratievae]|uniref:HTH cro/C1-type domain-containing protein n=1 Tax=Paracoccus kondratievae TaxID=135740 RepID=A0AAD3NVB3_9RHOB|nr:helix-turn-helix transcriptional regulator [Paracoccus kondratievae]AZV00272.1 type II toxin-antitoxin HipB-like antitoxin [Paracoccus phage vB_PkoS_Pkon1]GLK63476.1 hypothetical protein GCM10017635_09460 [Paracoccus kondratievae]